MNFLKPGEVIISQGDGWFLILSEENESIRFHIDIDAFNAEKMDNYVWLTRKSDQQKFYFSRDMVLEVVRNIPIAEDALFADVGNPGEYLVLKSLINGDMFIFHKGNLYAIEKMVKCTGDNTCEHCQNCPECNSLHCKHK